MTLKITCPFCDFTKQMPEEKIPPGAKWANCPRCKHRFEFPVHEPAFGFQGTQTGKGADSRRGASPWERRSELGTWQGFYETFKGGQDHDNQKDETQAELSDQVWPSGNKAVADH